MSFIDWLYSNRPATPASDPWGPLHILGWYSRQMRRSLLRLRILGF